MNVALKRVLRKQWNLVNNCKKIINKFKKITYEKNVNINKKIENLKKKPERKTGAEKY